MSIKLRKERGKTINLKGRKKNQAKKKFPPL
jgi:hypothetical protein